jgi:hypothetical protein
MEIEELVTFGTHSELGRGYFRAEKHRVVAR